MFIRITLGQYVPVAVSLQVLYMHHALCMYRLILVTSTYNQLHMYGKSSVWLSVVGADETIRFEFYWTPVNISKYYKGKYKVCLNAYSEFEYFLGLAEATVVSCFISSCCSYSGYTNNPEFKSGNLSYTIQIPIDHNENVTLYGRENDSFEDCTKIINAINETIPEEFRKWISNWNNCNDSNRIILIRTTYNLTYTFKIQRQFWYGYISFSL